MKLLFLIIMAGALAFDSNAKNTRAENTLQGETSSMETSKTTKRVSQILFQSENDIAAWRRVNDSVMGGVSRSSMTNEGQYGVFSGTLSLDNNGGFASVRRLWTPTEKVPNTELGTKGKLTLKVKGDGQYYQLRFRTNRYLDGVSYASGFQTKANEVTEHSFDLNDFVPVWRGRQLRNVEALAWEDIVQIGIMITQKQEGPFKLMIDSVSLELH
ncbi:CIA30 family protein [Brumicola blandensis]|uniref:CIA30 family protein n=1 Tax=Brumicola blandensis TaxID=3075611 RepID=A0AAW8R3S8_9ALTE|nr:CIA30 family protein [Alteromonas sp. W409]MDT0583996.1 CIA30 family protein [Alteromonas sp. W409]